MCRQGWNAAVAEPWGRTVAETASEDKPGLVHSPHIPSSHSPPLLLHYNTVVSCRVQTQGLSDCPSTEVFADQSPIAASLPTHRTVSCKCDCSLHRTINTSCIGLTRLTRMSPFLILLELRMMEMMVTTGTIRCAKPQSNRHHQQTNI